MVRARAHAGHVPGHDRGNPHTGTIVTDQEAFDRFSSDDPDWQQKFEAEFTWSQVGVPGSESRIVTGREVLMLGGLALLMTAAAVVVVERRRPY